MAYPRPPWQPWPGKRGLARELSTCTSKARNAYWKKRYVVDEYRTAWYKALTKSGDSADKKLSAVVAVDFDKRICQRNKLAVWFAFWGESRSRLTYRKICAESSREYKQVLTRLCETIIMEGTYVARAQDVAIGLLAMSEGLWLDLLLDPAELTPEQARAISMSYLRGIFPDHFSVWDRYINK